MVAEIKQENKTWVTLEIDLKKLLNDFNNEFISEEWEGIIREFKNNFSIFFSGEKIPEPELIE